MTRALRYAGLVAALIGYLTSICQVTEFMSIHRLENRIYKEKKIDRNSETASLFNPALNISSGTPLVKRVFGYHPYWAGYDYLSYQWDLLTDLCYFSYEVDTESGNPVTIHEWETSPAIDSALANGVRVHLCVTLFDGHEEFLGNPIAQATLIENIISLIQQRGAHGINMDVEALPSSQSNNLTDFLIDLCNEVHSALPDAEVSIAAPAVNWSNKFNITVLKDHLDFFMVMAYDYYWSGSTQAGPVSPLYSMVDYYNYNFSKSISYYQSQGVPSDMLLLGVPYYAYQWPTEGPAAPSATTGSAVARTYSYVKSNSTGNYSPENKHREENSFGPYFAFEDGGWYQCWIDDVYSMGEKFDIVNRRGLGGIGIWALGYDDGYTDFWELINEKFTEGGEILQTDTIYDAGGPAWDYYDREDYLYTITTAPSTNVHLTFSYLYLEEGYDTLWIYDGPDTLSQLINLYNGDSLTFSVVSSGNELTLRFKSDNATTEAGWWAAYDTLPVSGIEERSEQFKFHIYPNPFRTNMFVGFSTGQEHEVLLEVIGMDGKKISTIASNLFPAGKHRLLWNGREKNGSRVVPGIYLICLYLDGRLTRCEEVMLTK